MNHPNLNANLPTSPNNTAIIVRQDSALTAPVNQTPSPYLSYNEITQSQNVHLRQYWRIVKRRKWTVLLVILLGTMVGTLIAFNLKSMYQAQAIIEVGKDNPTLIRTGDTVISQSDYTIKTAIQLLQSRPLFDEIIQTLKLNQNSNFLDVAEKRSLSETLQAAFGQSPLLASDRRILTGVWASKQADKSEAPTIVQVNDPKILTPEDEKQRNKRLKALSDNLKITQTRDSRLLTIQYSHTDPVLATAITNALAKAYIDNNFRDKTNKYSRTSEWLDRTTRELKAKVEQSEQELANYTKANNIFNTDDKSTLTTEKLVKLHGEATRAESDRILKRSLYQEVQQGRVEQLPDAFSDPKLIELKKKLGELATQAAQLEVKFGGRNPKVQEVRQQMAAIEGQIKSNMVTLEEKLKADYERAARDESSLKDALSKAKVEASQENQAAIKFNLLKQNLDTTKGLYNDFLQKTTQAQAQVAEQYNNITMIEPAEVPTIPSSPKRLQNILLALLLSTVAGVGLALFMDYLDNTVKEANDITQYAQIPTLAMIPKLTTNKANSLQPESGVIAISQDSKPYRMALNAQLFDPDANSVGTEAYRILRTSILLSTAGGPPKKILFTSGSPSEGKSTTAVNTGISLARLGRSVLVIDADMRRPTIHKILGIENKIGLSNCLSGEVRLENVIKPSTIPNLSVLPSGIIPPNAAELVSSESMRKLLLDLSPYYDHILIDSPPLANVTDAIVISTMVDGVILLVSSGKCTREILRYSSQQLAKVNAKVLGAVLNNFDFKNDGYGYYDYNYYGTYRESQADQVTSGTLS